MSDGYFEILRESLHKRNHIPSGRQLPRTPPLADVKRHLDFCNEDPSEGCEQENTRDEVDNDQNRTFDVHTPVTKTEPNDLNSMLKGMTGYELTAGDLEFIEKMKEEKVIKKLQGDLEEVQRLLKKEMMAAELAYTTRETAQAELRKFPSCEELAEWAKFVLRVTSPSIETADLDLKSLLTEVTEENIQRAVKEKEAELSRMKKMIAIKKKERGQIEKQIAGEQLKLRTLMSQLFDLKSELAQEEEAFKALEMQLNTQEAAEIKVEAETPQEPRAAKSQVRRQRERKKAVKSPEKLQDTTNQSKSKRSKHTEDQTCVKDDQKTTSETLKAKQKLVKAARGQKKAEAAASDSQEPVRVARGRQKPAASQPKNQSKTKEVRPATQQAAPSRSRQKAAVAANDAAEAQNAGLRRSKRIASRS